MANILVVQNTGQIVAEIKQSLSPGGHQLLVVNNVESAKTLLEAASFDAVICGAHLNNGTVFDLLDFVKSDPNKRAIPFVCFCCLPTELAQSIDESVRTTAMLLGADKYLRQNVFNAEQFRSEIESSLLRTHQRT